MPITDVTESNDPNKPDLVHVTVPLPSMSQENVNSRLSVDMRTACVRLRVDTNHNTAVYFMGPSAVRDLHRTLGKMLQIYDLAEEKG